MIDRIGRREWWTGIAVVGVALLAHALFPRYEWRNWPAYRDAMIRTDRWTGSEEIGALLPDWGRWVSLRELMADTDAKARVAAAPAYLDGNGNPISTTAETDLVIAEIDEALAQKPRPSRTQAPLLGFFAGVSVVGAAWLGTAWRHRRIAKRATTRLGETGATT